MKLKKIAKLIVFISLILLIIASTNYKVFNITMSKKQFKEKQEVSFDWSAFQVVNDMKVGFNLGAALDRRDGSNRNIDDFIQDKYVIAGKKTKEQAYLDYYQTLDINQEVVTEEMIKDIKAAGFNAIRLPVTWRDHLYYIDDEGHKVKEFDAYDFGYPNDIEKQKEIIGKLKIEEVWINRVKEVTDWIINNGMYCMINAHADVGQEKVFPVDENPFDDDNTKINKRIKGWIYVASEYDNNYYQTHPEANREQDALLVEAKHIKYKQALSKLWTEIATEFADYGPKLIFEGFNEIRVDKYPKAYFDENGQDNYYLGQGFRADNNNVTQADLEKLNELNKAFVDAVRATGGNNASRFLSINTYLAELSEQSLEHFTIPNNDPHIIMAAHFYDHLASCTDDSDEYYKCVKNNGDNCLNSENNYCWPSDKTTQNVTNVDTEESSDTEKEKKPSTYRKMEIISAKAQELGVPVIIGEFSSYLDTVEGSYYLDKERVTLSHNYYMRVANHFGQKLVNDLNINNNINEENQIEKGITCFYWDDATTRFKLYKPRRIRMSEKDAPKWLFPKMIEAIMNGVNNQNVILNNDVEDMSVPTTDLSLNKENLYIDKGKKKAIIPTITPAYSDSKISFESADESIATVTEDGIVEGKSRGTTTITVSVNNIEKQVNIYIDNNKVFINFVSNDNIENNKIQTVIKNEDVNLDENTFTKTGYKFTEWNTESDGSGTSYENEETVNINNDITLYAQWAPIKYYINFNSNYGSGEEDNVIQDFTYDVSNSLLKNTFTKANYYFSGWNTKIDGTGNSYTDEEDVLNLTDEDNSVIELYAQWQKEAEYTINDYTYDINKKIIKDIPPGTTLNEFKNKINIGTGTTIIVDTKNVDNKDVIYTGGKTKIYVGNELAIEFTNIVTGDSNGDGKISSADLLSVRQHLLEIKILKNEYFQAADSNKDGKVSSADLLSIRQHLLGIKIIG